MAFVERLTVLLNFGNIQHEVGELVTSNRQIFFKYYPEFIEKKIEISPFKLPLNNTTQTPKELFFDGLFGVFNDSLPDGWGRLLVDRHLAKQGISPTQITPLDRLALIGNNSLGALQYLPQKKINTNTYKNINLDAIANDMQLVLEGESASVIDELYQLGGSSGGARPKIMVGYNEKTNHIIHGKDKLPKDYEHWIIKFPSSTDLPDVANIEYTYYKMAINCGIKMSHSKLFTASSGKVFFGTKRFDRIGNQRLHLHSVSGLLHDNFRLSNIDYGHIMDAAFRLENHVKAHQNVFRLACFNVLAHNRDDHSKNFGYLMDENGTWQFAPAYDLTFSSSSHGQHSTTVNGEGTNPTKKDLLDLANYFDIKNANTIFEQVYESLQNFKTEAQSVGVSKSSIQLIQHQLKKH